MALARIAASTLLLRDIRLGAVTEVLKKMNIIAELRSALPPVFLGSKISDLTGHAIAWGTVQNKRSRREIPDACFARSGSRVLVLRDPFLDWWETTLSPARRPPVLPPRRGMHRKRTENRTRPRG
jgi:hypothetical protein